MRAWRTVFVGDAAPGDGDLTVDAALLDDDTKIFIKRMGRWTAESLKDMTNSDLWRWLVVGYVSRAPLTGWHAWLMKHPRQLPLFVCRKARKVKAEWDSLLDDAKSAILREKLLHLVTDEDKHIWTSTATTVVLGIAVDWDRRITYTLSTFPMLLLWLSLQKPDEICEGRRGVAKRLLSPTEKIADDATNKLRVIFRAALQVAAQTGTMPADAWQFFKDLADMMFADSQEVEGTHNIIKLIVKLAPNISKHLLSSRITAKKTIMMNAGPSSTPQQRAAFVNSCCDRYSLSQMNSSICKGLRSQ